LHARDRKTAQTEAIQMKSFAVRKLQLDKPADGFWVRWIVLL
jgi:hypothetical protein